jgi:phosphate transport system substrate-binding protein
MVPIFNLPNITDLVLERSVLADIFCQNITHWNDPRIAATNPAITLPNQPINIFIMAEPGGTYAQKHRDCIGDSVATL